MNTAERNQAASAISIVAARHEGDRILSERPDDHIAQSIEDHEIVIFRGAFIGNYLLELRNQIRSWGRSAPVFPAGESASRPFLNFHRLDDGTAPTSLPHIFHIYGFGDYTSLPEPLRSTLWRVSSLLIDLQNRLAGTNFDLASGDFKTGVIQHPRGGGYLTNHVHPYLPQRVSLFLNLSEPGSDYQSGEARFKVKGEWVSTFADFRLGDILAWRYSQVHGISAVDSDAQIDWESDDGLWIFALEMVATHPKSRTV